MGGTGKAGAFLHLDSARDTARALTAYGDSFTAALHTCALVGGTGMLLAAAVAAVIIAVRSKAAH